MLSQVLKRSICDRSVGVVVAYQHAVHAVARAQPLRRGRPQATKVHLDGLNRASSTSSKRWQTRQRKDRFALNAKVQGLKSRAAFKLLEVS